MAVVAGVGLLVGAQAGGAAAHGQHHDRDHDKGEVEVDVVAKDLVNPRGLTVGPDGRLYVALTGTGSNDGSVVKVDVRRERTSVVASGLPSYVSPEGEAVGPHDVTFRGWGNAYVPVGLGADPTTRAEDSAFGWLLKLTRHDSYRAFADIAGAEGAENPDGVEPPDSNPHSAVATRRGVVVADAGANTLFRVERDGDVETLSVFETRMVPIDPEVRAGAGIPDEVQSLPAEPVPNSVTVGPDGAYYVGTLLGFPFTKGESRVYRVDRDGNQEVYAEGFTAIIDVAFDEDHNLYVLEIAKNGLFNALGPAQDLTGALIKVEPDGDRYELAEGQLVAPGGITIDDDDIYVTTHTMLGGGGTVLQIEEDD